jgi:hypothetical protein
MDEFKKCEGRGCSIKRICYRYTKVEEFIQVYFEEEPYIRSKDYLKCDYFIEDLEDDTLNNFKDLLNEN